MLKKLFRYDAKQLFVHWRPFAIISLLLTVAGSFAAPYAMAENVPSSPLAVLLGILFVLGIVGIVLFAFYSSFFSYYYFYKNFFTGEGYLMFTLPVKLSSLINAKLLSAIAAAVVSLLMLLLEVFLLLAPTDWSAALDTLTDVLKGLFVQGDFYHYVYLISYLVLALVFLVVVTLFLYCCISYYCLILKKAKKIVALGFYAVIWIIVSNFWRLLILYGSIATTDWTDSVPASLMNPFVCLILLANILSLALVGLLLYALLYWLLHRKLNLQ